MKLEAIRERMDKVREEEERKYRQKQKEMYAWCDYFKKWPWEWFCSLEFQKSSRPHENSHIQAWGTHAHRQKDSYSDAEGWLKKWALMQQKRDHIQIGYMGVYNTIPQPHIHLLVLGKNASGLTMFDLNEKDWEKGWSSITKATAVIKPITDLDGVCSYIAKTNMPQGRSEIINPYNTKLLDERKI